MIYSILFYVVAVLLEEIIGIRIYSTSQYIIVIYFEPPKGWTGEVLEKQGSFFYKCIKIQSIQTFGKETLYLWRDQKY